MKIALLFYLLIWLVLFLWLCHGEKDSKKWAVYFVLAQFWPITILLTIFIWFANKIDDTKTSKD